MVDWEWYQDPKTFRLFLYLLLSVNHEERKWQGKTILAGQRITSLSHLATESRMSVRSVRTALTKLKSTGEVTHQGTSKYSLITICNWSKYQTNDTPTNKPETHERQTNDIQTTTNKNDKNIKNDKNNYGEFQNVLLSLEEYQKLTETLSESVVLTLIAELDEYIESKGVKYKSHRATIQGWARRRINEHAQSVKKNQTKIAFS